MIGNKTAHRKTQGTTACDANFYALPFAAQMIVWATRKRLGKLHLADCNADQTLSVFHLANWGALYTALLTLIDILVSTGLQGKPELHAVHCPCLARHEAYLLNALAHLQNGNCSEAILCLCEIVAPTGARLAMPHLQTIVAQTASQQLGFAYVDLSTIEGPSPTRLRVASAVH